MKRFPISLIDEFQILLLERFKVVAHTGLLAEEIVDSARLVIDRASTRE